MKTKQLISMMFGCLAALCVTSCLDSDDNNNNSSNTLSKAQIAQCFMTVKGDYAGDLLYLAKSEDGLTEKVDTLVGKWSIPTDSTLIISDFSAKVLAELVSHTGLKKALAEAPNQDVKCLTRYVNVSPVQFLVSPRTLEYDLFYDGSTHKVHIVFYGENTYSFGSFDAESSEMMVKIIPAYLYVDEKMTNHLTQSQIIFLGKH
jgi:hypothetical protein